MLVWFWLAYWSISVKRQKWRVWQWIKPCIINNWVTSELQLRATCPASCCTFNIDKIGIWLKKPLVIYSMQLIINGLHYYTLTYDIAGMKYWIMPLTRRAHKHSLVDAYYLIFLGAVAKSPVHRCCSAQRRWCVKEVARLSADSALGASHHYTVLN